MTKSFPVIDLAATGQNILRLRKARGLTVRDLQNWFGFEEPQAIYKWQKGKSLPTVDNLYALGVLLGVSIEEILVLSRPQLNMVNSGQETSCPLSSQRKPSALLVVLKSFSYAQSRRSGSLPCAKGGGCP